MVIIAGDLHRATRGVPWLEEHFPSVPVIYLAGNHEFYGETVEDVLNDVRLVTQYSLVRFLENTAVEIGGVAFSAALSGPILTSSEIRRRPQSTR